MISLSKRCVVVPVDFSGESEAAISAGLEYVESAASLHVVHVMRPLDPLAPGVIWDQVTDETRKAAVTARIDELLAAIGAKGAVVAVVIGDPGSEIADYAQGVDSDLIVIPSHGHHGMKRLLLGSVAERVIRHAHCAVLVLRRSDAD